MTNEEAIRELKDTVESMKGFDEIVSTFSRIDAITLAIKALEQQPCDDCINRQEAIEAVYDNEYKKDIRKALENLPSVTPARAKGKWMTEHNKGYVQCSNCHTRVPFCKRSNFCPNCGAEMEV